MNDVLHSQFTIHNLPFIIHMPDFFLLFIGFIYLLIVTVLFVYGVNFLYMAIVTWRNGAQSDADLAVDWERAPKVTVQLPIYNERYVVDRLVDAVCKMAYPRELLQIQVLDDSTDDTKGIAESAVNRARVLGFDIEHLHRTNRVGYKAGALKEGLTSATGGYIAIFDADFVPPQDFLLRTVPHLQKDEKIAFVQSRWGHLNRDYSFITTLQALTIDAHFMVEQFARNLQGFWFNFNGTAGLWRKSAIAAAGGWKADTLTEDLDLSYRAYLNGMRGHYLRDLVSPAELPVSMAGFRRQQHRWAQGSLECAVKLIPDVWRSDESFSTKLHATLHLSGYGVHLYMLVIILLYPFMLAVSDRFPQLAILYGFGYLLNITALAPTIFFIVGQQQLDGKWVHKFPRILAIMLLGSGLMLNTTRAAWHVLAKRKIPFERTAKFGVEKDKKHNWQKQMYQLKLDPIVWWELALSLYGWVTVFFAFRFHNWGILFYGSLFSSGLLFLAVLTIAQGLGIAWQQRRIRHNIEPVSATAGD